MSLQSPYQMLPCKHTHTPQAECSSWTTKVDRSSKCAIVLLQCDRTVKAWNYAHAVINEPILVGIQYQFTRGGSSYYAVGGLPKLVPGLPKQHSAPRTPLLLAYPKFARPFDRPTQMKIPRTAPVVSIGQPRQNTDCKGKVLENRGSKQSGEGSALDPDLSVRFFNNGHSCYSNIIHCWTHCVLICQHHSFYSKHHVHHLQTVTKTSSSIISQHYKNNTPDVTDQF